MPCAFRQVHLVSRRHEGWHTAVMEIVIAIASLAAAIFLPLYIHRKTHPIRQLRYTLRAEKMVVGGAAMANLVTVEVDGVPLRDPHLVTIDIWSTGRADISSAAFDAGRPIIIEFGTPVLNAAYPQAEGVDPVLFVRNPSDKNQLLLPPTLLSRDMTSSVDVLIEGVPSFRLTNPLIDIEIREAKVEEAVSPVMSTRKRARFSMLRLSVWTSGAGFVFFATGLGVSFADPGIGSALGIPGMLVFALGVCAVIVTAVIRGVRRATSSFQRSRHPLSDERLRRTL